ncbi:TRAP transporter small permease subunit [Geitlerinema sp. CS-897]|uniref:TRAP transporter small permease subunit n=1 Tax=Baaleninema simplex TaxID=2862350 RepID=UPI000349A30D|nr:TRAP transporter small permease subunit [Baaleninema simplex]MDC0834824.1 TRAP transporter small permease subunit [Geitlerinema sp. CS-897]
MQTLLRLSRLVDRANESIGRLTGWLVLLMVVVGTWNVIGRYAGQAIGIKLSSNAFIETQWYLFSLVFLLGAAYTLKHNEHVRMDVLYSNWSPRRKALADVIGTLLFLIPFCAVALWFVRSPILSSWQIQETSPDPGGLPRYPIKTFVFVSFVLLILQGISEAIKKWAVFVGEIGAEANSHDANSEGTNTEEDGRND